MFRLRTGSRLHFGLLGLPGPAYWPNQEGDAVVPARGFGGVGLMVERPGLELTARFAEAWSATGPLADRALDFASRTAATLPQAQPLHFHIEEAPPEHHGLGTGTQLGLAIAQLVTLAAGLPALPVEDLARRVGRGRRSALGIHGFAHGGFLVEAGKRQPDEISPLLVRRVFPADWRILLVTARDQLGRHGTEETDAFRDLQSGQKALRATEAMCRLVLLGLIPALETQDLESFGEALYDFNRRAGELFAPVQGGLYSSPRLAAIIAGLRRLGVRGVAQSSWGPTIAAIFGSEEEANSLAKAVLRECNVTATEVCVTTAHSQGAAMALLEGEAPAEPHC